MFSHHSYARVEEALGVSPPFAASVNTRDSEGLPDLNKPVSNL
jgi:hypothetical protein